jgi:hypothetical protein
VESHRIEALTIQIHTDKKTSRNVTLLCTIIEYLQTVEQNNMVSVADPGIRDVYSGYRIRLFPSRIRDPSIFHPGSQIHIKEFKYFNQKNSFLRSRKYDPGCSSRIQESKRYRIQDPYTQH